MPITVDTPDGVEIEFPDSMKPDEIEAVLREKFPRKGAIPEAPDTESLLASHQPLTRAALAAKQLGADKSDAFSPFVPLGPDIKAETLPGQMLAAPYNIGKGFLEGAESRGGLATIPLGVGGKLAQAGIAGGFGVPAIIEGAKRVYRGTALGEPQEALEGALQVLTGGGITMGGVHGLKEAPKPAEPPPVIAPPKISEQVLPSEIAGEAKPSEAPVSLAVEGGVPAPPTPQAEPNLPPSVQVRKGGDVTTPVTEDPKPPIIGMGGATLDEIVPTGTSLKNAAGDLERAGIGAKDAPETVRKNMEQAWAKATTAEENKPGLGANLAQMLQRDPNMGLTDVESALLLRHKMDLFNRLNDAAEKTHQGDAAARKVAQGVYDQLAGQYSDLLDAVKNRGEQWGREGRWRQAMTREDFTFSSVDDMNRYSKSTTGRELPGEKVVEAEKKAKTVKEFNDSADAATDTAIKVVNEKARTPPKIKTPDMAAAERRAFDAANKTVREWAVTNADKDTIARIDKAKTAQELYEIQRDATKKALDAADKTVRENAKRVADAETKARTAKAAKDRADAIRERQAAQRVLDKANRDHRNAVIAMAKAERALQDNPLKAVWDKVREYLDKGVDSPDDIRNKVATDLGMKAEQVTRIMAQDPRVKRVMDDAWMKQQKAAQMRQSAKQWVRNLNTPAWERASATIPRALFGLKVGFHGTVALGTHAPTVAFQPRFWKTYIENFGKMYKLVGSPTPEGQARARAYFEQQTRDLIRRKNYSKARRGGLVNDPTVVEDFTSPETVKYFGNLTGMGNRGYTILKILRQDMFDQMHDALPRSLQVQDSVVAALADDINHSTGVVKGRSPAGANLALFAPRLEASRLMQLAGDPIRAARTFADWKNASAGEKLFAQNQVKQKLWIAGTYFSLLAANQGLLSAMGSKQKINFLDPLESDFLKFKIADHDVAYGSALVNMAKLPIRMMAALAFHGRGSKYVLEDERIDKIIGDYVRSQMSPFAGTATDLALGRDYAGRPLPRAGFGILPGRTDIPKRLRMHGTTTPYSWTEYGAQQFSPIPMSEFLREVWGHGLGMSDKQIEAYLKAFMVGMTMAGTGSRITEDKNIEKEQ